MKYRVVHKTEYSYAEQIPEGHNVIRLHPRDTHAQICTHHELTIRPTPADIRERVDFFGNHVTWLALQEPHERLRIEAISEVDVHSPISPDDIPDGPAWDSVNNILSSRLDSNSLLARQFLFDSPMIPSDPQLAEFARRDFPRGAPIVPCILNLTHRIFHDFTFDTGATVIGTPVLEVLKSRHGVCQDFAHLQIGCLRSLGLPARYISGYVLTTTPEGQPRLMGADASHAWISAYIPEYGWVDFDPTNGMIPCGEHITIGWARDYDDLSPVRGIITGGHQHHLHYSVDVEPMKMSA